jgi:hypothetical protein
MHNGLNCAMRHAVLASECRAALFNAAFAVYFSNRNDPWRQAIFQSHSYENEAR